MTEQSKAAILAHEVLVDGDEEWGWRPKCRTHACSTPYTFLTRDEAMTKFVCDQGLPRQFVVEVDAVPTASMGDLTSLAVLLRHQVQVLTHDPDAGELRVWLWKRGGHVEPMTVTCIEPGEFDGTGYTDQVWAVVDQDGIEHVRVQVSDPREIALDSRRREFALASRRREAARGLAATVGIGAALLALFWPVLDRMRPLHAVLVAVVVGVCAFLVGRGVASLLRLRPGAEVGVNRINRDLYELTVPGRVDGLFLTRERDYRGGPPWHLAIQPGPDPSIPQEFHLRSFRTVGQARRFVAKLAKLAPAE